MLLDDLANYLVANGAGTLGGVGSPTWSIWEGFMPDSPDGTLDQSIGVFEYPGYPRDTLDGDTETVKFQLAVRGKKLDYVVARQKWEDCFNLLQFAQQGGGSPPSLPGVVFIEALQYGPSAIPDPRGRVVFRTNFKCMRYRQ